MIRLVILVSMISSNLFSQSIIGKWKTIDDETGKETSVIEVFQKDKKIYGKIVEIIDAEKRDKLCSLCPNSDKNKPILGLTIIKGLVKDEDEYNDGQILDPKSGKLYNCYIKLDGKDKLKVRGFIGLSLLGRTQYWYRVKS
ncbi:MAG: DUF2147 domain-containing protein [Flavobacterium sp.]|uniref:DUF2147 domain-containing protein n=1 Tax=Flavobacterium sp. TaxID=239 RepID=UPI0022C44442|nr:DUF2147 domain-containing protein [Flavobacterium sp.]MCZ8196003.1 DUF2147 domain-containing protein [Flavobacterium sp.]